MKSQSYNFELDDLLALFVTALDGTIINRYHAQTRNPADQIEVGYVYSPKQKVLHDLVNKGASIKIPIVAININSISWNQKRVFNKLTSMDFPKGLTNLTISSNPASFQSDSFRMPVPVDISVTVSIITKFQRDLFQIIQNFIFWANPYFVVSWLVPNGFLTNTTEIRNKIIWSGEIPITTPSPATAEDTSHFEAETNFTIEGWVFGPVPTNDVKTIYFIDTQFIPTSIIDSTTWPSSSAAIFETLSSALRLTADNNWILVDNTVTVTSDLTQLMPPLTANLITEIAQY